jgi:hypothetical protein
MQLFMQRSRVLGRALDADETHPLAAKTEILSPAFDKLARLPGALRLRALKVEATERFFVSDA